VNDRIRNNDGPHRPRPPSPEELATAVDQAGSIASLLRNVERETRAQLYQALDLELLLDPVGAPPTIELRLQLCGGGGRICAVAATLALPG
jgi:hypothetical protein